jgi:hypothetical protein
MDSASTGFAVPEKILKRSSFNGRSLNKIESSQLKFKVQETRSRPWALLGKEAEQPSTSGMKATTAFNLEHNELFLIHR